MTETVENIWDFIKYLFELEGLKSDPETADKVLEHHPGFDRWKTRSLCSRAHGERGEIHIVTYKFKMQIFSSSTFSFMFPFIFFQFQCFKCHLHEFDLQADEARKYGARVYCVGIKDFDEQQVREL